MIFSSFLVILLTKIFAALGWLGVVSWITLYVWIFSFVLVSFACLVVGLFVIIYELAIQTKKG